MPHTPTPWRVDATKAAGAYGVWTAYATHPGHDGEGYESQICSVITPSFPIVGTAEQRKQRDGNATFIVHACNNFAALLLACKQLRFANKLFEEPDYQHNPDSEWEKALEMMDAAIAAAENRPDQTKE